MHISLLLCEYDAILYVCFKYGCSSFFSSTQNSAAYGIKLQREHGGFFRIFQAELSSKYSKCVSGVIYFPPIELYREKQLLPASLFLMRSSASSSSQLSPKLLYFCNASFFPKKLA